MSKKYKDHYLPVEVIIAATQGEAAAIQTVLKTYESYIHNKELTAFTNLSAIKKLSTA